MAAAERRLERARHGGVADERLQPLHAIAHRLLLAARVVQRRQVGEAQHPVDALELAAEQLRQPRVLGGGRARAHRPPREPDECERDNGGGGGGGAMTHQLLAHAVHDRAASRLHRLAVEPAAQVVGERARRVVSSLRLALEALHHDRFEIARRRRRHLAQRHRTRSRFAAVSPSSTCRRAAGARR